MNTNEYIARYIIKAQIASDAGKGNNEIMDGYSLNAILIANAIKFIRGSKKCSFKYYVVKAPDQNGHSSILVYFDWRNPVDGNRYQISFRNPCNKAGPLLQYINTGRKTHLRKSTSNRSTCMKMKEAYNL
jgi:hypothetical protein